ncbi:MAG TPA: LuxR C-terminal-related transcriptional regulator [Pseudomonas sp.]|jgi:LuxR family maltose regulon positive regulatory protein|nr:LuxR C-terminal-related transcriptional regulator [Pseudomonas sp.]
MTALTLPSGPPSGRELPERHFFRPPLSAGHAPRPQLCERLDQGLDGRLLLICAPAGFGKSSLASEFCERLPSGWRTLWLDLGPRDSDPGRFFERLLDGLRRHFPGLYEEGLALLRMRQPHQPFAFEPWLSDLLDELTPRLAGRDLLLVLDDYHLAQGAVLDSCLQFLLNHLPAGVRLLVTSRQRPAWHLARLRLHRQLLELQVQDLRLSTEEAGALVAGQGAHLADEERDLLLQRCEGWVAGLRLWLLARQDAPRAADPLSPAGADGLIHDYLLEEVIDRQPATVRAFLYQTACLDRFCAELCDALREEPDSAAILEHLKAHQVFLVPLDDQGRWFRYHHLFSDLLRRQSPSAGEVSRAALHLRACRWYSQQGDAVEAVEQALRAGRSDVAAELVQNLSEEQLLGEQNVAMLLRWKLELPDSLLGLSPRLIVLYGWALTMACQLGAAEALAARLGHFLPAPGAGEQRLLLAQWQALSGMIARGRGEVARAEQHCRDALDALPVDRFGQRFMCISTLANLAVTRGVLWRARDFNRQALELAQRHGNPLFEALAHHDRARALQARGEILRALDEVRLGLTRLQDLGPHKPYAVRARLVLYEGYLLALRLQPEQARARLHAGIREARACRDVTLVIGYSVLATLAEQAGDNAEAFRLLAECERTLHAWDVPPIYYLALVTLVKCELWAGHGQLPLAELWLARLSDTYAGAQPAAAPELLPQLPLHLGLRRATLARRRGQEEAAAQQMRELQRKARRCGALMLACVADMQLCLLLLESGRETEAGTALASGLESGRGGCLMAFLPLLRRHPQWLRARLASLPASALASDLLALLPESAAAPPVSVVAPADEAAPLSGRELAVLGLIAQGCSNQEISERLFISLHTVKSHARHINGKLGVERRTQAVARAQALGLLD